MKKSITLKELSKILGVSVSTVSKALNDSHEISEATKIKIRETAQENNYKPNRLAVNLKSGKTKTIGVVLPSIKNFFLARVLRGIELVVNKTDYNIVISVTNESHEKEVQSLLSLTNGFVDAIIIAVAEETQMLNNFTHLELANERVDLLILDRNISSIDCDKVLVDDYEAVKNTINKLLSTKKEKIIVASTINNSIVGKLRTEGYKDAVKNHHKPITVEGEEAFIEEELRSILEKKDINGIIALDEEAALASFRVAKEHKLFEKNFSLVGYAGRKISDHISPNLTTIDQHGKKVGRTAAKLIFKKLKNPDKKSEIIIVTSTLCERETTNMEVINPQ